MIDDALRAEGFVKMEGFIDKYRRLRIRIDRPRHGSVSPVVPGDPDLKSVARLQLRQAHNKGAVVGPG